MCACPLHLINPAWGQHYSLAIVLPRRKRETPKLATLKVGKSLKDSDVLWRYLSLDKFIDLLASKSLFFAPLAWYEKTDPFEGYLPHAAMEAMASVSKRFRDQHIEGINVLAQKLPEEAGEKLLGLRENVEAHVPTMKALYKNIAACLMVNCWYKSEHESEGMWGLYSRGGVAIRTSVGSLKASLAGNEQPCTIHIGTIKYIDFADKNLQPSDCITDDGQLMGMIKRVAYAHENEVRMYITRDRTGSALVLQDPSPIKVPVDVNKLIEAVFISPFAGELIEGSIRAVCKWAGLDMGVVSKSNLLDNCEYLLDAYG